MRQAGKRKVKGVDHRVEREVGSDTEPGMGNENSIIHYAILKDRPHPVKQLLQESLCVVISSSLFEVSIVPVLG